MKHEDSGWIEPDITINGHALTFAQAMTLRVAVGAMRISLSSGDFRNGIGEPLAGSYDQHLQAIEALMLQLKAPHD